MNFTWIIIIVIIVIIVCVVENQHYQSGGNKQIFKCPNKFEIHTLKNVGTPSDLRGRADLESSILDTSYVDVEKSEDNKILIYNTEIDKSSINMGDYKYTYKPKILMSTRILRPFKQSMNVFKHIDKDTIVTDTVEGFLPYLNYTSSLLGAESKYRVLSNIPNLKITSNEDYIYIKLPDKKDEDDE